jgi:hypothetical protein
MPKRRGAIQMNDDELWKFIEEREIAFGGGIR